MFRFTAGNVVELLRSGGEFFPALIAAVVTTGCNVIRGQSTPGQYVDDVAITAKVKTALAGDPRVAGEGVGHDLDAKVRLAAFAPAGMAAMPRGFVLDAEPARREAAAQLAVNGLRHGTHRSPHLPGLFVGHILARWHAAACIL